MARQETTAADEKLTREALSLLKIFLSLDEADRAKVLDFAQETRESAATKSTN